MKAIPSSTTTKPTHSRSFGCFYGLILICALRILSLRLVLSLPRWRCSTPQFPSCHQYVDVPKQQDLSSSVFAPRYQFINKQRQPHPRTILLNALSSIVAFIGLISAISAVVYIAQRPDPFILGGSSYGETIHSWTCKWAAVGGSDPQGGEIISPSNFKRLCVETRASFVLMCVLIGLETTFGAAAGLGWWLAIGMGKKRSAAAVDFETVTETKG